VNAMRERLAECGLTYLDAPADDRPADDRPADDRPADAG
jgi:hypothetical protein